MIKFPLPVLVFSDLRMEKVVIPEAVFRRSTGDTGKDESSVRKVSDLF
jgi:hypothetical protein